MKFPALYRNLNQVDKKYLANAISPLWMAAKLPPEEAAEFRDDFLYHGQTAAYSQILHNSKVKSVHSTKPRHRTATRTNVRPAGPVRIAPVKERRVRTIVRLPLQYQSGIGDDHKFFLSHEERREERDRIQRKAAKVAERMLAKSLPKAERKANILQSRDKRNPALQSGMYIAGGVCAVASVALVLTAYNVGKSVKNKADDVANFIRELKRSVDNAAASLKKHLGQALWFVPLVLLLWYFLKKKQNQHPFLITATTAYICTLVGPALWDRISKFFPDGDGVIKVDDDEFDGSPAVEYQSGMMSCAAELITVLVTFSVFKGGVGPREITEFVKRISLFDRSKQGFDSFIDWAMRALETLINAIRTAFGKDKVQLFSDAKRPAYEWMSAVDRAYAEHNTANAPNTTDELNHLVQLVVQGNAFKELYRGTPMARSVDEYLARVVCILNPHLGALNARNNFRQEPVSIMLVGEPGVGKTLISMAACITILSKSGMLKHGTFEEAAENIWQKGSSEFWNSYSNQSCVIMDDAFQQRVSAATPDNEFMNIIRMVSSWSFPLNMADLASKGKIFFGSKLIFGTTNVTSIESEARLVLQEPQAVARRINYGYRLHLLPEYKNSRGHLDMSKYEEQLAYCSEHGVDAMRFPWYMWEVSKHDYITGASESARKPLLALILEVARDLSSRSARFVTSELSMRSYAEGLSVFGAKPNIETQSGGFKSQGYLLDTLLAPARWVLGKRWEVDPKFMEENALFESRAAQVRFWWAQWTGGIAVIGLLGAGVYYCFKLVACVLKGIWTSLTSMVNSLFGASQPIKQQSNHPIGPRMKLRERRSILTQSSNDAVHNNIYSNSYKMYAMNGGTLVSVIGQVVFLRSDLAVMPFHFSRNVQEFVDDGRFDSTTTLHFRNASNGAHSFTMSPATFLALPRVRKADREQEFVKFKDVRAHRDIVSSFIKDIDFKYLGNQRAILDVCRLNERPTSGIAVERRGWVVTHLKPGNHLRLPGGTITKHCEYDAGTVPGDCGAPLCLHDNSRFSGRTAIGLHVAGAREVALGYSNVVTQEDIAAAASELGVIQDNFEADLASRGVDYQSGEILPFPEPGSFLPLGTVQQPINLCPKTKYYLVDYMDGRFGECPDRPAPLRPTMRGDKLVYPMANAVAPYATELRIYEQPWLPQAVYVAFKQIDVATDSSSRAIYTFQEAVQGIEQEKFRSIPRGTSAGYPYVLKHKEGKTAFFGKDGPNKIDTPLALELEERVEHIIRSAREGVRLSHIFQDFLKDELRSPSKVEAVATRLISASPLDYLVAVRRFFGAFCNATMMKTIKTGMAPGVCAYSDWTQLAIHLQKKGPDVFDGDFKGFDASEQPTIFRLVLERINAWYNDGADNARIREVLWLDLIHSRHIGGLGNDQRHVYQWNKSLPSGHPLTTIVNSIYCLVMLVGAYISLTGDTVGFWDYVSPITYGDDNASNVSKEIVCVFNQVTVSKALMKEFGMVYTPGRKDGVWREVMALEDITFLKRAFRADGDAWLAPLEVSSFLYTSYWCKAPLLERTIVLANLELALEELSLHERSLWDKYAGLILAAMADLRYKPRVLPEREQYKALVMSRTDNYY